MQSDRKLTSDMTPPSRRGGGERGAAKAAGRGRGRGGGGRGGRGGAAGAGTAGAEAPAATQATAPGAAAGDSSRNVKSKGDKAKPPQKAGASARGGRGSGAPSGRPARAAVSLIMRKVLVRNIPYDWDEDKLLELLETHGVTKQHVWRFVQGKVRANNRAPRPGRMYLDFKKDSEAANSVIEKLNGYVVADTKDQPIKLEVAFAPFQKVPREKQRKDAKVGTIDRDADFMAFLEALAKPKEKLPSADLVADAKDTEPTEKPVAALVLYLNERKRDKKGKFSGKSTDKARGTRAKSAKEARGAKEKAKGSKSKGSKASDVTIGKDGAKPRKTRGKTAPPAKEKSGETEAVAPGALKIMSSKNRDSAASAGGPPPATEASGSEAGNSKPKQGKRDGSNKQPRRGGQQGPKEASGDVTTADTATASPAKEKGGGGRGRRDSRPGKGPKSGGGRGDQPKKVFAPKATTPVG